MKWDASIRDCWRNFLTITRRESKIKPFIIENSWRGKIFSSQHYEGRVKDLRENSLSYKIDTFDWASNSFLGANKLRRIFTQRGKIRNYSAIKFTWSRRQDLLQLSCQSCDSLFTSKEAHRIKSLPITYHLICMHHLLIRHQKKENVLHLEIARESLALNNKYSIIHAYIIIHNALIRTRKELWAG